MSVNSFKFSQAGSDTSSVVAGFQPLNASLTAVAAVTVTSAGTALLDDASAAAQLVTLGLGATAAEVNARADDSVMVEDFIVEDALSTGTSVSTLSLGLTGAMTLGAPTKPAFIKVIKMLVNNGDVTLALTNIVGGSAGTTATFSTVGHTLVLLSDVASGKWIVLKEVGVVLT